MDNKRDFIYLQHNTSHSENKEFLWVQNILSNFETVSHLCNCVEIIDLNKLKIIRKKHLIEQVLRQPTLKTFQFIFNLN